MVEEKLSLITEEDTNRAYVLVVNLLKSQHKLLPNLTYKEKSIVRDLRNDSSIVVMKSDKGNRIVVLNCQDYDFKVHEYLAENLYLMITRNEQNAIIRKTQARSANLWQEIKPKLAKSEWFALYPIADCASRFYGLSKIHKHGIPIRPIVEYTNTPKYALAKKLASILGPLQEHSAKNAEDFVKLVEDLVLQEDESSNTFDFVSLFTKIPTTESPVIIKNRLNQDATLSSWTPPF